MDEVDYREESAKPVRDRKTLDRFFFLFAVVAPPKIVVKWVHNHFCGDERNLI